MRRGAVTAVSLAMVASPVLDHVVLASDERAMPPTLANHLQVMSHFA